MTRKDYEAIARIIRENMGYHIPESGPEIHAPELVTALADYMAQDNLRFNRDRFVNACGL